MNANISERLRLLLLACLGIALNEFVPDARILEDLGADSLDVAELVMALEETFEIEVPDEDFKILTTIRDIQHYVEIRTGAAEA